MSHNYTDRKSELQNNPKSKIIESGYINIYSELNAKEKRQVFFKTLYKKLNPGWDETQVYLSNIFRNYIKPELAVLDAGCGNGNYIIDENRKDISWVVGIDLDNSFFAKNICLDEIVVGDLEQLPFENESFDVVVSLWVLEHLKNPQQVFEEVKRVLKPNGVFIFATPNKHFIPLVIARLINSFGLNNLVNKILFGRDKQDIFQTYYKANSVNDVKDLTQDLFTFIELKYNYDPSYTSFNNLTFQISNLGHKLFSGFGLNFTSPHIIGILKNSQEV